MAQKFLIDAAAATDVGLVREENEDSFSVEKDIGLFVVADGLGGCAGGEVASRIAIDTVVSYFKDLYKKGAVTNVSQAVMDAINRANRVVLDESRRSDNLFGMGTTIVTALLDDAGRFHIANVGDSRAYLYRDGEFSAMSKDHSAVEELVDEGRILKEDARSHPLRNVVTRVIGQEPFLGPFQKTIMAQRRDILMLCSDGLWDMLSDSDIKEIISRGRGAGELCRSLIDAATDAGGEDNVTVIVVQVG